MAPLGIDRVPGVKAAGKGKGKSKDGKGKSKELKSKGQTDGKQNQWNSTSSTTWNTFSKGGKNGDQSGKGKSKSKTKDAVTGYNCRKIGHMAKNC